MSPTEMVNAKLDDIMDRFGEKRFDVDDLSASLDEKGPYQNVFIQEMVRAFYYGWYQDLVTELPPIANGRITAPDGPGLGTKLNPDVLARADATVKKTAANDL